MLFQNCIDMNIRELKEKIENLDDTMKVGASGYFGEFLECFDSGVIEVTKSIRDNEKMVIFSILIEGPGVEPD